MSTPDTPLCGTTHGAYSCQLAPKHAGKHRGYYVRDGRVYVMAWQDKYDRVTARLALPRLDPRA
jgi:hypothetical protein